MDLANRIQQNLNRRKSAEKQVKQLRSLAKQQKKSNFDPSILPIWALSCREVVSLCCVNMEFRRNVVNATDPRYKRILIQKARQICRGTDN